MIAACLALMAVLGGLPGPAQAETLRIATWNIELYAQGAGPFGARTSRGGTHPQVAAVVRVLPARMPT